MQKHQTEHIRAVLQALDENMSYREIEAWLHISKTAAGRIRTAAVNSGLSTQELCGLDDEDLQKIFYPPTGKVRVDPDWEQVHSLLKRKKVTLQMLFAEYEKQAEGETYTYASYCRRYNEWKQANGIFRIEGNTQRLPGERMEIDFVGDDIPWVDSYGEIHKSRLFVATLPFSCLIFCKAYQDETQASWLDGVISALEYFGGSPQVLVMDNARALVQRAHWHEPDIQPAVRSVCAYYSMQPWACRPASPKQKNRVEAAAGDVERWIIAQLTLHQPHILAPDIDTLNSLIRRRIDEINAQPFRSKGSTGSRLQKYEEEERSCMRALPPLRYELGQWRLLVADKAHCIRISSDAGHRYSVPAAYAHKKVAVRICSNTVEIYDPDSNQMLGRHIRCTNQHGEKTHILEEHLTAAEKSYRKTPADWIKIFIQKGLSEALADRLVSVLQDKQGKFPGSRTCCALLRLTKTYTPAILRKAIAQALEDDVVSYRYIKLLSEKYSVAAATNRSLFVKEAEPVDIRHENIRNNYE